MTGSRLLVVGGAALAVGVVGVLARPLLPPTHHATARPASPPRAVPADAVPTAERAATTVLRCSPATHVGGCGQLTVARTAAYTTGPGRVVVLLVGTLVTHRGEVPIAVRVDLTTSPGAWRSQVVLP